MSAWSGNVYQDQRRRKLFLRHPESYTEVVGAEAIESASSDSFCKLQESEIAHIIASGNTNALLFGSPHHPVMTGQEWSLRQPNDHGFIELVFANYPNGGESCMEFPAHKLSLILQKKITHVFGYELKLTELVVSVSQVQPFLNADTGSPLNVDDVQPHPEATDDDKKTFSAGMHVCLRHVAGSKVRSWDPRLFKSTEEIQRNVDARAAASVAEYLKGRSNITP